MRSTLWLLAAVLTPLPLLSQPSRDTIVTVSANRNTRLSPDRASLYLVVEGTAETPNDALARVDVKLKAVSEALKSFGKTVRTEAPVSYGVGPSPAQNGYPGNATPPTSLSRSLLRVQVDRLDQLGQVVAAAIGAGAGNGSSLSFESSVSDSVRRSRIPEVIDAARRDAEAVATALGAKLGPVLTVNASGGFGFQNQQPIYFDSRFGQQGPQPDVLITTSVTVQYRLVRQP